MHKQSSVCEDRFVTVTDSHGGKVRMRFLSVPDRQPRKLEAT